MAPNGNLSQLGRPKKRGRPSKADKLAIELARRVAGAVSAAAAAAKASAAKAREQVLKRGRGRPPKALKLEVGEESAQEEEEPQEFVRPKNRRKGAPRRAPGSTADWLQRPLSAPLVKRQPRDMKHLDMTATEIGKRETKRNPKFDEYVTFTPRKVESSADETSRNPLSSEAASDLETDSNAGMERKEGSQLREGCLQNGKGLESNRWRDVLRCIEWARDAGLLSQEAAELLSTLAQQHDKLLEEAVHAVAPEEDLPGFLRVTDNLLSKRLQSSNG